MRRCPGLAQEPGAGAGVGQECAGDDLERDGNVEVRVECLVGDAHGAAAKFPGRAVGASGDLVVLVGQAEVVHGAGY